MWANITSGEVSNCSGATRLPKRSGGQVHRTQIYRNLKE